MKFTLSTKPFANALDLGVVPKNVSKYYVKSCIAQLTATRDSLRINLEAASISTEIILRGSGDTDETVTRFVDCLVLKNLVGTLESSTVTIEYTDGGIILHSGTSKFSLVKTTEEGEMELARPELADNASPSIKIDASDWKFISDLQMDAIAMSFVHPVYTYVWVGQSGDVIVGDFDNSLFTFSKKNKLGQTCLLNDTIVNLFNSLPEGATLTQLNEGYRIDVKTDGFEYAAQFKPKHEEDEGVGSYNSQMILSMLEVDDSTSSIKVPVAAISKFLSPADLLSSRTDDSVELSLSGNELKLKDENIDCKITVEGNAGEFSALFETALLKSVLGNVDQDFVSMVPMIQEGVTVGIIVKTDNMSVVLGSRE